MLIPKRRKVVKKWDLRKIISNIRFDGSRVRMIGQRGETHNIPKKVRVIIDVTRRIYST